MEATWLILPLLAAVSACALGDCEFPIRRSRVLSAWQSSFDDGQTCFYNRSQADEESVLGKKQQSYRFFHSANKSSADGGFHWFAVQLTEPVLIRSVTVKGREDDEAAVFVYLRARRIEIWTSDIGSQVFSGDHCSSKSMSRQFNESQNHWNLCGVTESRAKDIAAGEIFTVNCTAKVRHLLLRRNFTAADASSSLDFMSFADLRLQTMQLKLSEPQLLAEGSSFTVNCELQCSSADQRTNPSDLQLCAPDGSCTAGGMLQIGSAQPLHSGIYTCRLGSALNSTTVAVLSSSPHLLVAENSSFTMSCSLHCGVNASSCKTGTPQLCIQNRSCSGDREMLIASAQPLHSGTPRVTPPLTYKCRVGSVEKAPVVTVLASSRSQEVEINSTVAVSCSLHCGGSELCRTVNSSDLQLCLPSGSCVAEPEIRIGRAQPLHSGVYTCKLGSVVKQTAVSVLHPPSRVSISVQNSDSCKSLSDLIVQFRSSASQPVPEHRCSADAGGARVLNLTRLSLNSSGGGLVSRWQLSNDGVQRLEVNKIYVMCNAELNISANVSFGASYNETGTMECIMSDFPVGAAIRPILIICSVGLVLPIAFIIIAKLRRARPQEPRTARLNTNSILLANSDLDPDQIHVAASTRCNFEPECSYFTVSLAAAAGQVDASAELQDTASDCTEYIEIAGDGD